MAPSAPHRHSNAAATYTPPYAAYARPAVSAGTCASNQANSANTVRPGSSQRADRSNRHQAQNEKHPAISHSAASG